MRGIVILPLTVSVLWLGSLLKCYRQAQRYKGCLMVISICSILFRRYWNQINSLCFQCILKLYFLHLIIICSILFRHYQNQINYLCFQCLFKTFFLRLNIICSILFRHYWNQINSLCFQCLFKTLFFASDYNLQHFVQTLLEPN